MRPRSAWRIRTVSRRGSSPGEKRETGLESDGEGREASLPPRSAEATSGLESEHADNHQRVGRRLGHRHAAAANASAAPIVASDRDGDDAVLGQEIGDVERPEEIGLEAKEIRLVDLVQIIRREFVEAQMSP
jgi:hypothetical protein